MENTALKPQASVQPDDYFYQMILDFAVLGWAQAQHIECVGLPCLPIGESWYLPFLHALQEDDWQEFVLIHAWRGVKNHSIDGIVCPALYGTISRALGHENAHSAITAALALRTKTKI